MCISMWAGECNTIYTHFGVLVLSLQWVSGIELRPWGLWGQHFHLLAHLTALIHFLFWLPVLSVSRCGFSRSPSSDCWLESKSWWGILTTCIMNHNAEETTRVTDWSWKRVFRAASSRKSCDASCGLEPVNLEISRAFSSDCMLGRVIIPLGDWQWPQGT